MQVKSQKYAFWELPVHKDHRGGLCAVEWHNLPFKPKRVYFLFHTKTLRGGHAHTKEKEVFVCLAGSFRARIHDGKCFRAFRMNKPGQALYTANLVWHEFDRFSKGAVLLAFSSTTYDGQKGYIMEFEKFKNRPSRLLSKESACRLSGSSDDVSASIRLHRRSAKH